MALTEQDQARIRQYLLGELSVDEQEKVEEQLMVDDDLFDELEISKGELIEEYRAGELNGNEQKWFEEHYLSSSEGRERRAFVATMDYLATPSARTPSLFERLLAFFKSRPWVPVTVAAAAVIVISVLVLFPRQQHTTYSITLPHMLPTRSTEGANPLPSKITLPPNTGELRASLELPKQFPQGTRFEVQLDNQTSTRAVSVIEQNEKVVTVTIPASELPHGEYQLKLTAVTSDGRREEIPGGYRFDIK
jgi:methionine-rich copper-binding protein CopC